MAASRARFGRPAWASRWWRAAAPRCLLAAIALAPTGPCAAELSSVPTLRIEPGMHVSRITSISTDAQGRWMVSASLDMTARVWDTASGQLQQVLRPPLDADADAVQALYAAAMSPDGTLIAVGGHVGRHWGVANSNSVFLFDRSGGRLIRRIEIALASTQWWSAVSALRFSPDGRLLAVGLDHEGLRLYEVARGREFAREERRDGINGLEFSPDGRRLVASALQGEGSALLLDELLDTGLKPVAMVDSQHMMLPARLSDLRFSPDGRWIAVTGSAPTDVVEVLDSATLHLAWLPLSTGISGGSGQTDLLAWSADGRLFGTGNRRSGGEVQVRVWSPSGQTYHDLDAGTARLFDLAALPDGRMLFTSTDPAWGVISADGRRLQQRAAAQTVNFSAKNQPGGLGVSANGRRVQFRFQREDANPTIFDLDQGYLIGRDDTPLAPPPPPAPSLDFDLRDPNLVKLNGRALAIRTDTTGPVNATCLTVAPDRNHFALCARRHLLYYSAAGAPLWQQAAPGGVVNEVALSADGRWLIAACGDGAIRWYRTSDGSVQLALFVHADHKRWVVWTPSGFYNASAAGEDLVGWHVNRGKNAAADFYPLSRCRAWFSRPDVIARVLDAGDEAKALRAANEDAGRAVSAQPIALQSILPPVVTILSQAPASAPGLRQVTLQLALRTPADAPVTAIRARVNALPVALSDVHDLALAADSEPKDQLAKEITVPLPAADAVIQVFAENKNATSMPALLQVLRTDGGGGELPAGGVKPKLFVLAVGVSNYDNPDYRLGFAAKDASDFAKAMQKQKGALYRDVEVKLLTNEKARRDAVLQGLEWLRQSVTASDVGILLLAGHGLNDRLGVYYYAPANIDLDALDRTGVQFSAIKRALASVAGRAVFFVDTCHAGNALGGRRLNANVNGMINDISSAENGVAVLSASTGKQEAEESAAWGHGAFTKAILEGVGGAADYLQSGHITLKMMDLYLSLRVKELTAGQQTPVIIAPFGLADFEIARNR